MPLLQLRSRLDTLTAEALVQVERSWTGEDLVVSMTPLDNVWGLHREVFECSDPDEVDSEADFTMWCTSGSTDHCKRGANNSL